MKIFGIIVWGLGLITLVGVYIVHAVDGFKDWRRKKRGEL